MHVTTALKASLAAIVLASSFAMPAAAHGDIRRTVLFYVSPSDGPIGGIITYCDGHRHIWGEVRNSEHFSVTDDYICP
ncbi:MAG: hypothetical protein KKG14_08740 [Alphaproteobacteria bacterium]|nr:hypothetical protein [Alphaproteobacteria bacterium]MBU2269774.1 hypothetical protein [Alphaproteobacteria bacterium]MBU2418774.1 hypothetical protein [Alphaproteobacteria bacterium]